MSFKTSHLLYLILCLSLLIFIYYEFFTTTTTISEAMQRHPSTNRKMLSASKFDFTPFLNHHLHHHYYHSGLEFGGIISDVTDPRYGVEKRLVPSGPNPLHH
ncbi:CLAVATA3/ESR (CLE)-related protein 12 [Lactuca sativa]|uniref:CLAVATA3/ESR (CLE)-related protein 12 n=1 Tax=Lactuca sativa TaxID=4236 RepID=UPI000CC08359|nr:CLAVATA3/ESR (CLE)-related protein 12 [Lactuca sativa]